MILRKGRVAEWLGSGLQNHLQRFESARDLRSSFISKEMKLFLFTGHSGMRGFER